jgi:hypothetical protein
LVKEAKAVAKLRAIRRAFDRSRLHYGERREREWYDRARIKWYHPAYKKKEGWRRLGDTLMVKPHPATLSVKIERA